MSLAHGPVVATVGAMPYRLRKRFSARCTSGPGRLRGRGGFRLGRRVPAIAGAICGATVASGALSRLGNFPSAFQFFPPCAYRLVIDTDVTADLTVAQAHAFGMCKCRPHRPLFVVVCAPETVRLVGTEAVPLRLLLGALMQLAGDFLKACLLGRLDSMETIGEPIAGAIVEDDHRGKFSPIRHGVHVVEDRFKVDSGARLRSAIGSNHVSLQKVALRHCPLRTARMDGHAVASPCHQAAKSSWGRSRQPGAPTATGASCGKSPSATAPAHGSFRSACASRARAPYRGERSERVPGRTPRQARTAAVRWTSASDR